MRHGDIRRRLERLRRLTARPKEHPTAIWLRALLNPPGHERKARVRHGEDPAAIEAENRKRLDDAIEYFEQRDDEPDSTCGGYLETLYDLRDGKYEE